MRTSTRYCPIRRTIFIGRPAFRISSPLPPVNLIYAAHGERMKDVAVQERRLYASVDAAFIGQNVYLFCASERLAMVFRGAVDYQKLDRILNLPEEQFVTFAQTVGYAQT